MEAMDGVFMSNRQRYVSRMEAAIAGNRKSYAQ